MSVIRMDHYSHLPGHKQAKRAKCATPMFPSLPVFFVPQIDPLLVFDGMTIFRSRGTKNTSYAWLIPVTD